MFELFFDSKILTVALCINVKLYIELSYAKYAPLLTLLPLFLNDTLRDAMISILYLMNPRSYKHLPSTQPKRLNKKKLLMM